MCFLGKISYVTSLNGRPTIPAIVRCRKTALDHRHAMTLRPVSILDGATLRKCLLRIGEQCGRIYCKIAQK